MDRVKQLSNLKAWIAAGSTLAVLSSSSLSVQAHQLTRWESEITKAERLYKEGKRKKALTALFEAYKDLKGVSHAREHHQQEFVRTIVALARSYREAVDYRSEYQTLKLLAAFYRYKGDTNSIDYADCLWQLGINCDRRKEFSEGLANLKEAAEIYRSHPLISKEKISRIERGLGHLYSETGQYGNAEEELTRAIILSNQIVDENTHDLGRALMLKAKLYKKQGQYKKAISLYRDAVDEFRKNLRRGHLWISEALGAYTGVLQKVVYDLNTAKESGDTTWNKEELLLSLAQAQLLNNSFYDAVKTLEYLKTHYEKNQLTSRVNYARCLELLGECCLLLEDYKDGIKYQKQAIQAYSAVLKDEESTASALITLSKLQHRMKQMAESKESLAKAEDLVKQIHGEQSRQFGECLQLQVSWLLKEGKLKEIQPILKELAKIYPDAIIPEKVDDEKAVKELLVRLSYLKNDRFHTELWHDWEKSAIN